MAAAFREGGPPGIRQRRQLDSATSCQLRVCSRSLFWSAVARHRFGCLDGVPATKHPKRCRATALQKRRCTLWNRLSLDRESAATRSGYKVSSENAVRDVIGSSASGSPFWPPLARTLAGVEQTGQQPLMGPRDRAAPAGRSRKDAPAHRPARLQMGRRHLGAHPRRCRAERRERCDPVAPQRASCSPIPSAICCRRCAWVSRCAPTDRRCRRL